MSLPATMKAIQVAEDEARTLSWTDVAVPELGEDQVLVRVHATAVNRADLLQRLGRYPVPAGASQIMGLEVSGVIEAVGGRVRDWAVGDVVCALLEGGGYAELVAVDASMLLPVPQGMSIVDAAAVPEVFYTAYLNLYMEGELAPGETALVHAASSGVGTAALQLCKAFSNRVIATTSKPKMETARRLGAVTCVDRHNESFLEVVKEMTDGRGANVILDPVGAAYLDDNLKALAPMGRLVIIGLLSGPKAEINLGRVLINRQRIIGSVLRSRSRQEKVVITEEIRTHVWPLFEKGAIRPVIDRTLPITDADLAHQAIRSNTTIGKVVMQVLGA